MKSAFLQEQDEQKGRKYSPESCIDPAFHLASGQHFFWNIQGRDEVDFVIKAGIVAGQTPNEVMAFMIRADITHFGSGVNILT